MMKPIYITTVLFIFSLASAAQQFQGGLAAGLVGSQVAGDTYSGFRKAGVYTGLWVRYEMDDRHSVQTEISYFQKGSRHNPDEKRQDFTFYLMRLGYIEMPFLYQYHLKNQIILEAGLSFSYLLHSYEALDYEEVSYGNFSIINPSFMAGIEYPVNERLSVHLRFNNSILSIRSDAVNGARYRLFDRGQYNDCVVLFVGYKL